MDDILKLRATIESLAAQITDFVEEPNKTKSKNLRLALGEVKKNVTDYRSILMELDKEGY